MLQLPRPGAFIDSVGLTPSLMAVGRGEGSLGAIDPPPPPYFYNIYK